MAAITNLPAAGGAGALLPAPIPPPTINESTYPVVLSVAEKSTFDLPLVRSIISGADLSPSKLAELKSESRFEIVNKVNDLWKAAAREYQAAMFRATIDDMSIIGGLDAKLTRELDSTDYAKRYGKRWLPCFLIGGLFGYLVGREANKKRDVRNAWLRTEILRDQSAHRRACYIKIAVLEEGRQNKTRTIVEERLKTLSASLSDLARDGETDTSFEEEMCELGVLYKKLYPGRVLKITDEIDLETRITQITNRVRKT